MAKRFLTPLDATKIKMNQSSDAGLLAGELIWDNEHGSLMFGLPNNIPLEIGLQTNVHVKNTTGSTIGKGTAVYVYSADSGMPLVAEARADSDDQIYRLVGITNESIANNSVGYVTYDGIVSNIDTSAFAVGDELYVSSTVAGDLVSTPPSTPNNVRVVGYVLTSNATTGRIFVRVGQSSSYDRTLTLTANTPALNLTGTPSASATTQGLINIGTLSWSDTNIVAGFAADVNSYAQVVVQNKNAGTTSSADFIVSNDTGSASSNYGDFGINSSGFTGSSPWNDPAGTYLYANGGSLTLGTQTTSNLRLVVNNVIQATVTSSDVTFVGVVKGVHDVLPFSRSGALTVGTGATDFMFPYAVTILGVSASLTTAPTGASVIIDVDKNGTTIFTNQANRPTIAASATATASEVTNMDVTSFAAGDKIRVNIDQIGSTIAGSDLTVVIRYRRA
jgi:hypothetical protein